MFYDIYFDFVGVHQKLDRKILSKMKKENSYL